MLSNRIINKSMYQNQTQILMNYGHIHLVGFNDPMVYAKVYLGHKTKSLLLFCVVDYIIL